MKIWLADLTHTQQTIASDVIPAGVGMIAEYALTKVPEISDVRLFKYPEELARAFSKEQPHLIGFSNYCWNSALSLSFAKEIKRQFPSVTTVVGGPHFPADAKEQEVVLRSVPWVDYYVSREAEHAFASLLRALIDADFEKSRLPPNLPNLSFLDGAGKVHSSPKVERILDLTLIPSPYLSGRLDEFFDGRLLPVIQTARGCPFTCTFCTEGLSYWNKVRHKTADVCHQEILYIAEKLHQLPKDKRRTDLLIADSNFGMFKEDIETCKVIAEVQDRFEYPKYINVATGKNKKERILEAASLVRGAMKFAGSVQSLDPAVQENIKRKNISADQIMDMAIKSSEIGANTYSEVILGLPGDSLDAHFRTLETLVDSGFNTICMYTLMMLTGTEMGTEAVRRQYGMQVRYRVIP
ncbi:MAG: cobalamin-dependent protein, partial [Rhodothermales bacterium]|nr:cobalamin-dependent protein [Rhodothermales bacterium]